MLELNIKNFGPVQNADVKLNRFSVLIGPQSSGKSTISKLIYFFLHIRDEVTAFIVETAESGTTKDANYKLKKRLRNRFVEFFGPAPQVHDTSVRFSYTYENYLEISLDKHNHKYLSANFSESMSAVISKILNESIAVLKNKPSEQSFISAISKYAHEHNRIELLQRVRQQCNDLFGFSKELFFIPAGRSLLSTLSDQIQYIHPHQLDYTMRQFVETVNSTRIFFNKSLDEIILDRQALSSERIIFSSIRKAQGFVKRILNGEYRYDKDGGKIYLSSKSFTKISYASSGQQEAVWILLSLFMLVLEKSKTLVFVEEPEAHLFPDAQKEIIEFIAFVFNEIGCDFLITTHSPYVLSCINNLLYAYELGQSKATEKVQTVIPKERWLKTKEVGGYYVSGGEINSLISNDTAALKTELLDSVSSQINTQFDELLSIEQEVVSNAK